MRSVELSRANKYEKLYEYEYNKLATTTRGMRHEATSSGQSVAQNANQPINKIE